MTRSWEHRLKKTPRDHYDLFMSSRNWNTCAVGEALGFPPDRMRPVITRIVGSRYPSLCQRGMRFYNFICNREYDRALSEWKHIQTRYKKTAERIKKELKTAESWI